jgi:alkanesulfonate monooxygenase SsuD/methylene tetrahydromethanopterin reductase-like flavin-dependent oxidoreductase (luciferase family)
MVATDWAVIREEMAGFGRAPDEMTKVYSNFVYVLRPGETPDSAAARFRVFSGMDLDYWREFYLLGEAEEVAERIRGKVAALGGVEHVILNPLDWEPDTLERLASDVLPLVRD